MHRTRVFAALLLALATLAVAGGCQARYELTINPDGSGRLTYTVLADQPDPPVTQKAEWIITRSKGIDAWADVSLTQRDDGRAAMRATAYFPDVNALHIHNGRIMCPVLTDNDDGAKTLSFRYQGARSRRSVERQKKLTEQQITQGVAKMRAYIRQQLSVQRFDRTHKSHITFIIDPPGQVKSVTNMKRRDDGRLEVTFDAVAVARATAKVVLDDKRARAFVAAGDTVMTPGDTLMALVNEELFGQRGPVQAVLAGPFEPKFDYAKAVAKAETDPAKIVTAAGIIPKVLPKPGDAGNLRDVKVTRAQVKGGVLSVGIKGALPEPGVRAVGAEFYRVVDDRGRVLLPRQRVNRFTSGGLDADGKHAKVSIGIGRLPEGVASLKQMAGVFRYYTMGPLKSETLGTIKFGSGAKLDKHQFTLVKAIYDPNRKALAIRWDAMAPPMLARVILKNGNKEFARFDLVPNRKAAPVSRPFIFHNVKPPFPDKLTVIFMTAQSYTLREVPFVVQNVTLWQE